MAHPKEPKLNREENRVAEKHIKKQTEQKITTPGRRRWEPMTAQESAGERGVEEVSK